MSIRIDGLGPGVLIFSTNLLLASNAHTSFFARNLSGCCCHDPFDNSERRTRVCRMQRSCCAVQKARQQFAGKCKKVNKPQKPQASMPQRVHRVKFSPGPDGTGPQKNSTLLYEYTNPSVVARPFAALGRCDNCMAMAFGGPCKLQTQKS